MVAGYSSDKTGGWWYGLRILVFVFGRVIARQRVSLDVCLRVDLKSNLVKNNAHEA